MKSIQEIAEGLSPTARAALPFLDESEARSPYNLKRLGQRGGFTTLEALERRGLVKECGKQLGRIFRPHTTYAYRLTPLGIAVRDYLNREKKS